MLGQSICPWQNRQPGGAWWSCKQISLVLVLVRFGVDSDNLHYYLGTENGRLRGLGLY